MRGPGFATWHKSTTQRPEIIESIFNVLDGRRRGVLSASNLLLAGGLVILGYSHSVFMLSAAWLVLGIGMGFGLYDAAFGALGRIYGSSARRAASL